jgi:DNA-binding transcriptional ArsR family regulator
MRANELTRAAPVFAALGDATRLALVTRLCSGGPQSIARLAEGSKVSRQAITKHLHTLADAGLAKSSKQGREQIWSIEPARFDEAQRYLDRISTAWDSAIERLRAFVEECD